jgi:hypothetical protein
MFQNQWFVLHPNLRELRIKIFSKNIINEKGSIFKFKVKDTKILPYNITHIIVDDDITYNEMTKSEFVKVILELSEISTKIEICNQNFLVDCKKGEIRYLSIYLSICVSKSLSENTFLILQSIYLHFYILSCNYLTMYVSMFQYKKR